MYCQNCGGKLKCNKEATEVNCTSCNHVTYFNSRPVGVALIPVEGGGVVTIRRKIEPAKGKIALVGGYLMMGESWQNGLVREVKEEIGIELDSSKLMLMRADSTPSGNELIIFAVTQTITKKEFEELVPCPKEISGVFISQKDDDLAFPLHTTALREYFKNK
jgi:8-oxo-dGTP diphosphatase